ncbi:MAG: hypothetical protein SFW64_01315 [Alphaproteobacteria bacterium]|nr:hypothetical protein [Alphaproteobacteria bacterium]
MRVKTGIEPLMTSAETTAMKLKSTPTGGVDASHSPYYRRLLSAGYKGFLQGSIGGASLYGTFGLIIGGLLAIPLLATPIGWGALALIPAAAGVGVLKGASTFGSIGSVAAINAESSDLAEQRRYLLDRYYDLPEGPEGDKEAEAIRHELQLRQNDTKVPEHMFHWKTVAVGALVGAALAFGFLGFFPTIVAEAGIIHGIEAALGTAGIHGTILTSVGALAGALSGAVIGLDRYYVRKWFDHTEGIVHGSSHSESALVERSQMLGRLKEAAQDDEHTKAQMNAIHASAPIAAHAPSAPTPPISSLNTPMKAAAPDTKIQASGATLQRRMADLEQALSTPAI